MLTPRRIYRGVRRRVFGSLDLRRKIESIGATVSSTKGPGVARFDGLEVGYPDPLVFYMELKDIWKHRIYHFESDTGSPRILDCGSHIGMSVLYFKHAYPQSSITAFEPDPQICAILAANLERNDIRDVEVVNAALFSKEGDVSFAPDVRDAGRVVQPGEGEITVRGMRLDPFLKEPVDFLKMNIEGMETDVIRDSASRLRQINQMVIEYHGEAERPQDLHELLALLDQSGFRYLIHDFDEQSVAATKPPFRMDSKTRFVLLVYARRWD